MTTQPELVEQLFEAALAIKPAERGAFLDRACSRDPELRRTVEELLAEDAKAGSFLSTRHLSFLTKARYTRAQPMKPAPLTSIRLRGL